jgi:hypothetical protein
MTWQELQHTKSSTSQGRESRTLSDPRQTICHRSPPSQIWPNFSVFSEDLHQRGQVFSLKLKPRCLVLGRPRDRPKCQAVCYPKTGSGRILRLNIPIIETGNRLANQSCPRDSSSPSAPLPSAAGRGPLPLARPCCLRPCRPGGLRHGEDSLRFSMICWRRPRLDALRRRRHLHPPCGPQGGHERRVLLAIIRFHPRLPIGRRAAEVPGGFSSPEPLRLSVEARPPRVAPADALVIGHSGGREFPAAAPAGKSVVCAALL